MNPTTTVRQLCAQRVIPVLRLDSPEATRTAVHCLHAADFRNFEITLTTPGALELIADLTALYPDSLIGAGTVLDAQAAQACIARGARFLVSPCRVPGLVAIAHEAGAAALAGAYTPGEVHAALVEGADIVKIFPAASGGPAHLAALRAVFPAALLCPTGGVSAENAGTYLAAGATLVGIGNNILDRAALARGERAAVIEQARGLLAAIMQWSN